MRYFDRAGLFAEACQEYGFLSPEEEKNSILAKPSFTQCQMIPCEIIQLLFPCTLYFNLNHEFLTFIKVYYEIGPINRLFN